MNYYEHHLGDYDANTSHLTWAEDMAYTRLIRLYYRKEVPITGDMAQACRLVRAGTDEEKRAVESVLNEFFELSVTGWHQKRCDFEIARYQKKVEHNRSVGILGGRPRKQITQTEPNDNPVGLIREPKPNPLQTPVSSLQSPDTNKEKASPAKKAALRFSEFWDVWPASKRKGAKPACLKVWEKNGFDCQADEIFVHVKASADDEDWKKDNGRYIPAPLAYLNQQRWEGAEVEDLSSKWVGIL